MIFDSINSRIAVKISVAVAFSISILVIIVSNMTNNAVFEIQRKNMEEINSSIKSQIEDVIHLNVLAMKAFAGNSEVKESLSGHNETEILDRHATELIGADEKYQAIAGFNSRGEIVFGVNSAGSRLGGLNIREREYFNEIMGGKPFAVSDIIKPKDGLGLTLIIAVPVRDEGGKLLGGVFSALDWQSYADDLIGKIEIGESGYGYIINSKGRIIAHKADKSQILKDVSSHEFIRDSLRSDKGFLEYIWGGKKKVLSFERVPETGWVISMTAYVDDLTRAATHERNVLIGIGLGIIILLVGGLVLVIRKTVIVPITNIQNFTRKIADGNYKAELEGDYLCELRALADNIEIMVSELKNKLGFSEGVLKGISIPSVVADSDEKVLFVNKAMLALCGRRGDPSDHLGKNIAELISGDASRKTFAGKALAEKRPQNNIEADINTYGGGIKSVLVNASPLYDLDGKLLGAFVMINDMTEIKRQQRMIEEKNITISEAAERATEVSNHVSEYSQSLAAQVEQSSRGAEQQSSMASETATAMEEMNSTVMEVAKNAANAANTAEESKAKAIEGQEIVSSIITTMKSIRSQSEGLRGSMADLGKQAEGIGNIMGVISDIADQTNLLALNAAIEAARAGDAGRGFAVVADEVRKLAEKTMTATNEVGDYIRNIQDSTRKNIANTEVSSEAVKEVTEQVGKSGAVLQEIVEMVADTTDQVRSIAAASEEQSAASEQISRATERINSIADETSKAMNESASAVNRLAGLAGELKAIIANMQG